MTTGGRPYPVTAGPGTLPALPGNQTVTDRPCLMPEFHIASERLVNDGDQLDARPGRHRRPETPGAYARAVPVLMYLAAVLAALVTIAGMLLLAAAVAGHLR